MVLVDVFPNKPHVEHVVLILIIIEEITKIYK